jgi:hypothetical protein
LYDINTGVYSDKNGRQCHTYPNPPQYDPRGHHDVEYRLIDRRYSRDNSEPYQNIYTFETPNRLSALARDDFDRPNRKRSYTTPLEIDEHKRQNTDTYDVDCENYQSNLLPTSSADEQAESKVDQ